MGLEIPDKMLSMIAEGLAKYWEELKQGEQND